MHRSPSFSRSSSSTRITILPPRMSSIAACTRRSDSGSMSSCRESGPVESALMSGSYLGWLPEMHHVTGEHVYLEVHQAARLPGFERGHGQRVRHEHQLEAAGLGAVHRQRDAVDRDGALGGDVARELARGSTSTSTASPAGSRRRTRAMPSTCPLTKCPPRRLPALRARSRFTSEASGKPASVVTRAVSGEMSASNPEAASAATVRHTPFTATDSPSARPANGAAIVARKPSPALLLLRSCPVASTMPVNISESS